MLRRWKIVSNSNDDISYLDFELSDELLEATQGVVAPVKSAAIVTSINDIRIIVALCVMNNIEAAVMPSGVFGTIVFLKQLINGEPELAIKRLTTTVKGLDAVLMVYNSNQMVAQLYHAGKMVRKLIPTQVVGNLSDMAEDALIGQLNLFELENDGSAQVSFQDALKSMPANYTPKKYQKLSDKNETNKNESDKIDSRDGGSRIFFTKNMPKEMAERILASFKA